ncbi:M48 family metalloprotease [Kocuria sp. M4R2S49]|uniref:M48 family metalloprotease n=1 Tax=Kocuria rhizosphaericola TaxID=3376284 RepID=UPI00378FFEDC
MSPNSSASSDGVTRLNVLSYPSPTTGRYILFLVALVASGLFVGSWLFNEVNGDAWARIVAGCQETAASAGVGSSPEAVLARVEAAQRCAAPAERVRGVWHVGGAAAVAIGGLVVLRAMPSLVRRRRGLVAPPPKYGLVVSRFEELAGTTGLRRMPQPVIGPQVPDAFSFGRPGEYTVALPRWVVVGLQRPGPADGVVRHEFAHIRHRDVELAWLARSVWYVVGPLLLIPALWGALSGDLSLVGQYLWRTVLLAVAVELVAAALLRSREHDADLRAGDTDVHLETLREALKHVGDSSETGRLKQLRARHPGRDDRLRALESPELITRTGFVDAATAAFLGALVLPLVASATAPLLALVGPTMPGEGAGALLVGPLLGLTVGMGMWRARTMEEASRTAGFPAPPESSRGMVAFGVATGLPLGALSSLGQAGTTVAGLTDPLWLVVPVIIGAGTVALTDSLGRLWAPMVRLADRPWKVWLPAAGANIVLFTASTWAWSSLQAGFELVGWPGVRLWLVEGYSGPALVLTSLALSSMAVLAALFRKRAITRPVPSWLVRPRPTIGSVPVTASATEDDNVSVVRCVGWGAASGLVGAVVLVGWRLITGPAATETARWEVAVTVPWVGGAAAGGCVLGLALARPKVGPAAGLVAGPAALLVTLLGFLAFNLSRGGALTAEFVGSFLWPAITIGFLLSLCAGATTAHPWHARSGAVGRRAVLAWALSLCITAVAALVVVGMHPTTAEEEGSGERSAPSPSTPGQEQHTYATMLAPQYGRAYQQMDEELVTASNLAASSSPAAAGHLRSVVLPRAVQLRETAEAYAPLTDEVATIHSDLVAALELTEEKTTMFADALDAQDPALYDRALAVQEEEYALLNRWDQSVRRLQETGTAP